MVPERTYFAYYRRRVKKCSTLKEFGYCIIDGFLFGKIKTSKMI